VGEPASIPVPLEGEPARSSRAQPRRTSARRLWADKLVRWVVTAGGLAIIASVLGILVFIVHEVLPLFSGARVAVGPVAPVPGGSPLAALTDEYRELVAILGADGVVRVVRLSDRSIVATATLPVAPATITVAAPAGPGALAAGTSDGRVILQPVLVTASFPASGRVVTAELPPARVIRAWDGSEAVTHLAAEVGDGGRTTLVAAATAAGSLGIVRETSVTNDMTGEVTHDASRAAGAVPADTAALVLDTDQRNLYVGTRDGRIVWWRLADGVPSERLESNAGAPITALSLLLGGRSLLVGRADGSLAVWFPLVRGADRSLVHVRDFPRRPAAVTVLSPAPRGKGALALDANGGLALVYSTSERTLWEGTARDGARAVLAYAPKADGAITAGPSGVSVVSIRNPHPEISARALLGKIWYEGYAKPEYSWQSSSGTEDFEPKLSLVPLLFGTLKGTIYSLFLAVPLGVLSAMYASQFLHPSLRRLVKPSVEIMASLPSVVLGFLAGLWLAPLLEHVLPSILLMLVVLPVALIAAGAVWEGATRRLGPRVPAGTEVFFVVVVLAAAAWACLAAGPAIESDVLRGTFPSWVLTTFGVRYDQRNAIVVGLAMGIAVIPIIFAIAEDALSNVPRTLVSGSLALGATRWQTVTRIVLPTASPGIFAAIIVGFGRAVGETMIVLMATGNTPITDWSPFNGFRTLSANIATEIPEAPQGGTLYRTLFLAALLLFALTFLVNTAAELIRQRLRRKYASL